MYWSSASRFREIFRATGEVAPGAGQVSEAHRGAASIEKHICPLERHRCREVLFRFVKRLNGRTQLAEAQHEHAPLIVERDH